MDHRIEERAQEYDAMSRQTLGSDTKMPDSVSAMGNMAAMQRAAGLREAQDIIAADSPAADSE